MVPDDEAMGTRSRSTSKFVDDVKDPPDRLVDLRLGGRGPEAESQRRGDDRLGKAHRPKRGESSVEPLEQAEPTEQATPPVSSAISRIWPSSPGKATLLVCGSRRAAPPLTTSFGIARPAARSRTDRGGPAIAGRGLASRCQSVQRRGHAHGQGDRFGARAAGRPADVRRT